MTDRDKLVYEIVEKIKLLHFNKITTIAKLINYNSDVSFVDPLKQGEIFDAVIQNCRKENIYIEIIRDEFGGLAFYYKFRKINL